MPQYAKTLDLASRPDPGRTAWGRPYVLAVLGLAAFLACLTVDSMVTAPTPGNGDAQTRQVVVRSWNEWSDERALEAERSAVSRPRLIRAVMVAGLVSSAGWWWPALLGRLTRGRADSYAAFTTDVQRATDLPVLGKLFPLDDAPATTIVPRRINRTVLLCAELVIAAAWAIPVATILAQPDMLARYRENPISAYCESIEQIAERLGVR